MCGLLNEARREAVGRITQIPYRVTQFPRELNPFHSIVVPYLAYLACILELTPPQLCGTGCGPEACREDSARCGPLSLLPHPSITSGKEWVVPYLRSANRSMHALQRNIYAYPMTGTWPSRKPGVAQHMHPRNRQLQ